MSTTDAADLADTSIHSISCIHAETILSSRNYKDHDIQVVATSVEI